MRELQEQGAEVIIAADERPFDLLKKEFPELAFVRLPGFSVKYPQGNGIARKIIAQLPMFVLAMRREHRELKRIVNELDIDAVISDNRFGLFSKEIPCIFVTHQIGIAMPDSLRWAGRAVYLLNKFLIGKYTECWIPDYAEEENLSGKLSHYYPLPKNAVFVGPLTRFRRGSEIPKEFDILVLLSGPEPQRTLLENIIMEQLKTVQRRSLVVRGIPEKNQSIRFSEWTTIVSSLESDALNRAVLASDIVISRPGYSTIMDLDSLGKQAIFIPTPGQTEQEYLAADLERAGRICVQRQEKFSLSQALEEVKKYPGFALKEVKTSMLRPSIERLLTRILQEHSAAVS